MPIDITWLLIFAFFCGIVFANDKTADVFIVIALLVALPIVGCMKVWHLGRKLTRKLRGK